MTLYAISGGQAQRDEAKVAVERERLGSRLLTTEQLLAIPPPSWLIEGILPANSLSVLWGPPASGKSFLALDWALSIATGSWWLGHEVVRGDVLYIAAEGTAGLGQRVGAWSVDRKTNKLDGVSWLPDTVNLLEAAQAEALQRLIDDRQPIYVVIDTLARAMAGGDENSAQDMGRLIERADGIRKDTHATVKLVHHATKEGSTARGSGALKGAVDTEIEMKKDGAVITAFCRKQKDADAFAPISLRLVQVALTEGTSCVLFDSHRGRENYGPGADTLIGAQKTFRESFSESGASAAEFRKALMDALGVSEATTYRLQNSLVASGFLRNTGTARYRFFEAGPNYF